MEGSNFTYIAITSLIASVLFFYNAYTGIVKKKAVIAMRFGSDWFRGNETGWLAVIIGIISLIMGIGLVAFAVWFLIGF